MIKKERLKTFLNQIMNRKGSFNNFITFAAVGTNGSTSLELIFASTTEKIPFSGTRVLKAIITFITSFLLSILDQVSLVLVHRIAAFEAIYFGF